MKSAIVKRMVAVLVMALVMSGVISAIASYKLFEGEIRDEMMVMVKVLDESIDRDGELNEQFVQYSDALEGKYRLTLIAKDGTVLADSKIENVAQMENHRNRKEVMEALSYGIGYETRQSDTFAKSMIYVAVFSGKNQDIMRIAMETSAMARIISINVPVFLCSFMLSLGVAAVLTEQLAKSITKPLTEIAAEMSTFDGDKKVFHFKKYPYRELNTIADTTAALSRNVRSYVEKLEKEKQVRQEFFSNASHELKTPLTAIRGYTELLQSGMATNESMGQEFLSRIHREVQGMNRLVNDILKISRLETKEIPRDMTEVPVDVVCEDIMQRLKPLADENGIVITVSCPQICVYMSQNHLEEIVGNLLINAIKYNQPDGKVIITAEKNENGLVLSVEDTGIGISDEDRTRVFERFYRVDKGRSKRIGGTGLGLSIVKHIVSYYGGTIVLSSALGKGSCFTIYIPEAEKN